MHYLICYLSGMRGNFFISFLILAIFSACSQTHKPEQPDLLGEKMALLQTDRAFSALCLEKGIKAAYLEYIDSNGVLLRPDRLPIVGANAIDFIIAQNDTGYQLNWRPESAFISAAADMGYIYGVYALHPSVQDTVIYGTYVSIWKKQANGKWKFVLDSGNDGIDAANFEY